jgi:hypothetical protein
MSVFMISQLLIAIAICFDLMSFQFKQKRMIVTCLSVSVLLTSFHFALLAQWTAAALMLLAAVRYIVTIFSHSKRLMFLFLVANFVLTVVTFGGLTSLFSFAGGSIQTIASFSKSDQRLRQIMLVGISFWLVNHVLAGSPMAVMMELLFIGSNLVGYYRFYGMKLSS